MKNIPKPFQKGRYWYFWCPMPDGSRKCRSTGETSQRLAKVKIHEMLEEMKAGLTEMTFRDYAEPFFTEDDPRIKWKRLQTNTVGESYRTASRTRLENHVFTDTQFCRLLMSEITPRDCQALFARLEAKLGRRNILDKVRQVLSVIFNDAVENDDIPKNPMRRLGRIQYESKAHAILSKEQLRALFADHSIWGDEMGWRVFRLALLTGMRQGEVLALSWRQVDLDEKTILIDRAWKTKTELGLPKWNKVRTIPICPEAVRILKDQRDESIRLRPSDLVFCYDDGSRLGITWWIKRFHAALESKKIAWREEGIKPHGLRHAVNTYLLEAGANPIMIDEYLGWSKRPQQLTRVQVGYTHPEMWDLTSIPATIEALFTQASGIPQA